ncbi:MAG TPA: acyltransferase [Gaiellaceae bacterium]|nr:acyltransferase [Gaiellaceae bacterium]
MEGSVALDQWRGVALLLVLVSHGLYFTDRVHGAGRVGVNLFFFISGLLVSRSLARNPSAPAFLWRRLRRLVPALVGFVAVMLPVTLAFHDVGGYRAGAPWALLFAINYRPPVPPVSLGHLWSVSCEMQFYALAPVLLLLGGRIRLALLVTIVSLGVAAPVLDPAGLDKYHFEFAVWPMMLGFCCERWRASLGWLSRGFVGWASVGVAAGALALMPLGIQAKQLVIAGGSLAIVACFSGFLTGRSVPGPAGGALTWLGRRTYSIYLWQQPLTICGYLPAVLHPLGAAASTLVGAVSYRWLERPFLSSSRSASLGVRPAEALPVEAARQEAAAV